jgi:diguanylate cyclase (GGDEF)-like protein
MPPDPERVLRDLAAGLPAAATALDACQAVVVAVGRHTPATISVLLRVHDRLRCVAATGTWQVFSTVPPGTGVVGRVYASGRTEAVPRVDHDPDYLPLRPDVTAELCTPVLDSAGRPVGVLDMLWTSPVDPDGWRETAETAAALLSARIGQLGGPPMESRGEKLLRHATALTTAATESDLLTRTIEAARDVSGLGAAVLVIGGAGGPRIEAPTARPDALEARIRVALRAAGQATLRRLMSRAHRYGAAYTLGEAGQPATADHEPLISIGVSTLVAVPVGSPGVGGVLLVADERPVRPDPTTVNLIELLAAQSWVCLDRLRGLARLHEQATSDPLTGLRHQGPFGERIAAGVPGRTALLTIDVDKFKIINDTYGHEAGNRALVDLARALQAALRQGDELYRIGGDEFVAVVEVNRVDEAVGIAERLVEAARRTGRTISVGVALQRDGESPDAIWRRADTALYAAKREGRDRVHLSADVLT